MSIEIRDQRKPGWFWADRDIILKDGECLGPYSIAIYAALCCYADTEHKAFPSVATLAEKIGCSERKARECLADLERANWIKSEPNYRPDGSQTSNTYHLLISPYSGATGGYSSAGGGYSGADKRESVKDSKDKEEVNSLVVAYEKTFGFAITGHNAEKLDDMAKTYHSEEWVIDALKIAGEANKRDLRYVEGILRRWQAEGRKDKAVSIDPATAYDWGDK